jgi:hypothetical protein
MALWLVMFARLRMSSLRNDIDVQSSRVLLPHHQHSVFCKTVRLVSLRQAFPKQNCYAGYFLYPRRFERSWSAAAALDTTDVSNSPPLFSYLVVNFYHLADVEDPGHEVQIHREHMQRCGWDIHGRIYISTQGINAQLSGLQAHAEAYAAWVATRPFFKTMKWRTYPVKEHMFPRLKLKFRENLISLHGGMTTLPVTGAQTTTT